MGVVYKSLDTKLDRHVALKFLPDHLLGDQEIRKRFEREAKAAAALLNPNICPVFEIDEVDGKSFISMAYIEGEPLHQKIERGPLKLEEALDIARQIAQGLDAAHEKGIFHRDIKPENIMVDAKGHVTIMDFGLAQLTEASRLTKTDQTMGTVFYMSPEQTEGSGTDHRTDIWALGVVIYEMITGQKPFKGDYDKAIMYSILNEAPEPMTALRTGVPMLLEEHVNKCLAKHSGKRYQSAGEVLVDLSAQRKRIDSGRTVVSETTVLESLDSAVLATQPNRTTAVVLVVSAALVLLAAAFFAGTNFSGEGTTFPTYTRLTFRPGTVTSARFAPDGETIVYSAAWEGGRRQLFTTRPGSSESRSLNIPDVDVLAISKTGEMALALRPPRNLLASLGSPDTSEPATLLQASLAGGAPREVLTDVLFADFTPEGQLGIVRMVDRRARIELPIGNVLYETPDHIGSFRISPSDSRIAFSERPFGFGGDWTISTVNQDGEKTVLTTQETADNLNFVWAADGRAIWYDAGWLGGDTIRSLTPSGDIKVVHAAPVGLRQFDISRDGRVLVDRVHFRVVASCLTPGHVAERDLSWFDASEVDDITSYGEKILMTEFGDGGGLGRWGVYLRDTSGEPAVRLGDGQAFGLSPDNTMALTMSVGSSPEVVLLPTGAGEPIRIRNDEITNYEATDWMPDGRQFVFARSTSGHGVRCYIQDIAGGEPRPITPEGYRFGLAHKAVSPTGEWIAAKGVGPPSLFPIAGGERREIPGVEPRDDFIAWSADGRSVFLKADVEVPANIYKVDVETGKRSHWKTLAPADTVGVFNIWSIQISEDEQSYCYSYGRNISDLYMVEGLRWLCFPCAAWRTVRFRTAHLPPQASVSLSAQGSSMDLSTRAVRIYRGESTGRGCSLLHRWLQASP